MAKLVDGCRRVGVPEGLETTVSPEPLNTKYPVVESYDAVDVVVTRGIDVTRVLGEARALVSICWIGRIEGSFVSISRELVVVEGREALVIALVLVVLEEGRKPAS